MVIHVQVNLLVHVCSVILVLQQSWLRQDRWSLLHHGTSAWPTIKLDPEKNDATRSFSCVEIHIHLYIHVCMCIHKKNVYV